MAFPERFNLNLTKEQYDIIKDFDQWRMISGRKDHGIYHFWDDMTITSGVDKDYEFCNTEDFIKEFGPKCGENAECSQTDYKPGDIYEDWESLSPCDRCPVEGDLIVRCGPSFVWELGQIRKVETNATLSTSFWAFLPEKVANVEPKNSVNKYPLKWEDLEEGKYYVESLADSVYLFKYTGAEYSVSYNLDTNCEVGETCMNTCGESYRAATGAEIKIWKREFGSVEKEPEINYKDLYEEAIIQQQTYKNKWQAAEDSYTEVLKQRHELSDKVQDLESKLFQDNTNWSEKDKAYMCTSDLQAYSELLVENWRQVQVRESELKKTVSKLSQEKTDLRRQLNEMTVSRDNAKVENLRKIENISNLEVEIADLNAKLNTSLVKKTMKSLFGV